MVLLVSTPKKGTNAQHGRPPCREDVLSSSTATAGICSVRRAVAVIVHGDLEHLLIDTVELLVQVIILTTDTIQFDVNSELLIEEHETLFAQRREDVEERVFFSGATASSTTVYRA